MHSALFAYACIELHVHEESKSFSHVIVHGELIFFRLRVRLSDFLMSCIDLLESTLGFLRIVRVLVWMPEGICRYHQLVA